MDLDAKIKRIAGFMADNPSDVPVLEAMAREGVRRVKEHKNQRVVGKPPSADKP